MANRKIGAIIALDGEQQFKSAVTACTRELNTMKSALKLVEAQTDGQAKSLETLQKKHDALNDVLKATKSREEEIGTALQHAKDDRERVKNETEEYRKKLTEAEKALEEMKSSGEATDAELKKQQELIESLTGTVESGEKAYEKGGARIQDWEKKLNDAKTETVKAEKAVDDIEDEMRELETATDKAADQLDDYGDEAKDAAKQTDGLDISLKSMIKNSAVNLAVDAMRSIGDKAIEAAKYVVDVGSTFEASMDKVAAISGATGGDLDKLTEKAKEMGSTTKFSASESAEAFEYMAMAGWKTNDMLEGIDGIMALAAASGADLATTSDIVTDALTAFGEEAGEAGRLADIMAAASSNANTNVEMMGETFKYAAPVAGSLGASMEDTAVAIGLMANVGIKASQAGTSLRTGLTNLAKPTKQMKEWMDKYNIALVENEDGSVNLRETMIKLREKMGDLSETEQAAAAAAIFGKDSMAGWLGVINASDEDFNKLITAIDNSNGAAQNMADTMQNNLSGAMTIFKSALEGLGIELYGKAVKPLTGAVEFATGVINGLTNLLKDHRSENDKVMDDVVKANKAVEESLANVGKIQTEAAANAGKIDVLTQALVSLNTQDGLDEAQKRRLKEVYDELVKLVPDLAGKYDEETGKVNATTEAIYDLTKARKDEIIEAGRMRAINDIYDKMGEALGNLQLAAANVEGLKKQHSMWEQMRDKVGEAAANYSQFIYEYNNGLRDNTGLENLKSELMGIAQEALNTGAITTETYNEIDKMFRDNWTDADLNQAVEMLTYNMEQTDAKVEEATGEMEDLQKVYDEANISVTNLENSTKSFTEITEDELKATDDSVRSTQSLIDEKIALKKATDKSADATKTNTDAVEEETKGIDLNKEAHEELRREVVEVNKAKHEEAVANRQTKEDIDEAIKSVHAQADAEKTLRDATQQARDDMTKAFDDIQKSVESAFNLNPFEQWQQDLNKGWEAFDGAMLSQIEGMKNYQTNMDLVREHLSGKAPDFVKFLEDMGQSGAQFVDDLARGIREGGEASISSIDYTVGLWRENHSLEDAIEDSFARSKLTAKLGLEGLTDSDVLAWEDLGYAFDEGKAVIEAKGGELSQTTTEAFWGAIDAAKAAGMQVPKEAADAIRNSEDPEQAMIEWTGILNESLRARGQELLVHAQELGIQIPSGITSVLQDKGATAEQIYGAMDSLIATIKTKDPDFEAAGTEAGEAAGSSTAEGITNKTGDIEQAASDAVDAAKKEGLETAQDFSDVGEKSMDEMHGGIDDEAGAVATGVVDAITGAATSGETKADTRIFALGRYVGAKMITGIESRYGNMYDAGYDAILNAVNGMTAAMGKAQDAVRAAMSDIASTIANTQLNFPSIQIPHVRWTWEWLGYADGGGTYYPNFYVDWYAKAMKDGMILDNPTIFGMMNGKFLGAGEAGSETVVGTSRLMDMIGDAVDDGLTSFGTSTNGINSRLEALLEVVADYMPQILEAAEADKRLSMDDNFVPMIANRTSEIIGRNARRLM